MCQARAAAWPAPGWTHHPPSLPAWPAPMCIDGPHLDDKIDPCTRLPRRGGGRRGGRTPAACLPPLPPPRAPAAPLDAVFHSLLVGVKSTLVTLRCGGGGGERAPDPRGGGALLERYVAAAAAAGRAVALSPDELTSVAAGEGVETSARLSESPPGSPTGPCYLPPARAPPPLLTAARIAGCGRLAVAVGAHYFGRAAAACPRLAAAAAAHATTAALLPPPAALAAARAAGAARPLGRPLGAALARRAGLAPGAWPAGVLAACVWLGAKVVGDRRRAGGLAAMVAALCGPGARRGDGPAAEADVLEALEWRLGPFFVVEGEDA